MLLGLEEFDDLRAVPLDPLVAWQRVSHTRRARARKGSIGLSVDRAGVRGYVPQVSTSGRAVRRLPGQSRVSGTIRAVTPTISSRHSAGFSRTGYGNTRLACTCWTRSLVQSGADELERPSVVLAWLIARAYHAHRRGLAVPSGWSSYGITLECSESVVEVFADFIQRILGGSRCPYLAI